MTLAEQSARTADRLLEANAGAYPLTIAQLQRTAHALGLKVQLLEHPRPITTHVAGDVVTLVSTADPAALLAGGIHELAERTAAHPDPGVRHAVATRIEAHYRRAIARTPEELTAPPAPVDHIHPPSILRTEAPDTFDDDPHADDPASPAVLQGLAKPQSRRQRGRTRQAGAAAGARSVAGARRSHLLTSSPPHLLTPEAPE
ncbi:MAG: hypothetical protein NT029_08095 [Armatimonadetes bacterium]|nr:hypothetical protein [Armatimonadota bacterium]